MKNNTKDSKQMLFEMMQKVNPDFKIIKEEITYEIKDLNGKIVKLKDTFPEDIALDIKVSKDILANDRKKISTEHAKDLRKKIKYWEDLLSKFNKLKK